MSAVRPRLGDVIEYRPLGGGPTRRVVVDEVEDDIKNGYPGFGGHLVTEDFTEPTASVWGYDDQIVRFLHRSG